MAYVTPQDRVRETATTTGTGSLTLSATSDYRRFADVAAVNDTVDYAVILGSAWEVGIGTVGSGNTLARTTVKASSNGNALVNFGAGVKDVFMDFGAHVLAASIRKDIAQILSGGEKTQVLTNIGAQPVDVKLSSIAGLTPSANQLPYFASSTVASLADLTAFARTLLDDTTGAAMYTTMGATQSLGTAGYFKFPSGWIIQWGTVSGGLDVNVNFPIAFPTACRFITGQISDATTASNTLGVVASCDNYGLSAFSIRHRYAQGGGTVGPSGQSSNWLAVRH